MECPFVWAMPFCLGKKYYYMIVKKEGGIAPLWSPRATQAKSARARVLIGAKRGMKENSKTKFLAKETT